jgi:serine protease
MKISLAALPGACVLACSSLLFTGCAPATGAETGIGCESPTTTTQEELRQSPGQIPAGTHLRPATERVEATPETVAQAMAQIERRAKEECQQWADKAFEEFEQSAYKEPFPGGKYIVSGDIAISDRQRLREFFETRIKGESSETVPGALIVHRVGGRDAIWDSTLKKHLTYCVSSAFGDRQPQVIKDIEAASGAWEEVADVEFIHIAAADADCTPDNANVVFDIRPVNVDGQYLARAFFPNEERAERNLLIDESSFHLNPDGALQLVGILRHELGHTLGWRHEHTRPESGTCFEDNNWRPLTDYDRFSVMHYPQCNGGADWSLKLTHMDKNGAACVYGAAPGFNVDPQICRSQG